MPNEFEYCRVLTIMGEANLLPPFQSLAIGRKWRVSNYGLLVYEVADDVNRCVVGRFTHLAENVVNAHSSFCLIVNILSKMLKERQLSLLHVDTLASLIEILLVQFKADEVAFLLDASDGGCAAAHAVVQHRVALVGVGLYEV